MDFLKKIPDSIGKGIKTVGSKSKQIIETTKLKNEIKDIERSIEEKFKILGRSVYEMLNRESINIDELKPACEEISSGYKKLIELEQAVKQIEVQALKAQYGTDIVLCQKCGSKNKAGGKYCISCGAEIILEKTNNKICGNCGILIKENSKFCIKCGTKIS